MLFKSMPKRTIFLYFFSKWHLRLEFTVAKTTDTWQKIIPAINTLSWLFCIVKWFKSVCSGFLHVQSSHRGSFRKAGVFFRNETVRVTSSPAFLKTWTWEVKKRRRNIFIAGAVNCEIFSWFLAAMKHCALTSKRPGMESQDKRFPHTQKLRSLHTYFLLLHFKKGMKQKQLALHVKKIHIMKWDKISCGRAVAVRKNMRYELTAYHFLMAITSHVYSIYLETTVTGLL